PSRWTCVLALQTAGEVASHCKPPGTWLRIANRRERGYVLRIADSVLYLLVGVVQWISSIALV
ncbi:hypothetical protein PHLCEN_2v4722, partial [Hermanssonia centrifuga]